MRRIATVVIVLSAAMAFIGASARGAEFIALKSGETTEVQTLYWISNCRSMLRGAMTVEILDGPPDVTASIREQDVTPRNQECARPVHGGVLLLTAKEIKTRTQAKLVLRVTYPTVDGERQKSRDMDLMLLP